MIQVRKFYEVLICGTAQVAVFLTIECGPMRSVMAALPNMGGALCSAPQSLADAQYWSAAQYRCQDAKPVEIWGTPANFNGHGSQPPVGRRSPYCGNMWRRYCCIMRFFSIADTCLNREDIVRQSCAMKRAARDVLASFCVLYFQRAACSTFQTCILNSR